jgi:hypothetical protein
MLGGGTAVLEPGRRSEIMSWQKSIQRSLVERRSCLVASVFIFRFDTIR